jgi:hypothetical protein
VKKKAMTLGEVKGMLPFGRTVAWFILGLVASAPAELERGTVAASFTTWDQAIATKPQAPSREQVQDLVKQLGSAKYANRQAAQKALLDLGPGVVPFLDQLKVGADLETQRRIEIIRYQLVGHQEEILRFLASQLPRYEDKRPEVLETITNIVARHQPKSGNLLLSLVKDAKHPLNWPAVNLFAQAWASHTPAQLEAYLQCQFRLRASFRPRYPAKVDAAIEMGYYLHYGWGSWPKGLDWKSRTTHYLDGQPYGKPFHYDVPGGATTGWLWTGKLAEGKHVLHFVVEYTFMQQGKEHQGKIRSPNYAFEVVAANTPDDLIAAKDALTDKLVRQSLTLLDHEHAKDNLPHQPMFGGGPEPDPWRPQITWKTPDGKDVGLHVPIWRLDKPLPVDLCFAVEFEDLGTGNTYQGYPWILAKGKTSHLGYLWPLDVHAFAKDRAGFVTVRVHLTPSRALALSSPEITSYFPGSITQELRIKIIGPDATTGGKGKDQ